MNDDREQVRKESKLLREIENLEDYKKDGFYKIREGVANSKEILVDDFKLGCRDQDTANHYLKPALDDALAAFHALLENRADKAIQELSKKLEQERKSQ